MLVTTANLCSNFLILPVLYWSCEPVCKAKTSGSLRLSHRCVFTPYSCRQTFVSLDRWASHLCMSPQHLKLVPRSRCTHWKGILFDRLLFRDPVVGRHNRTRHSQAPGIAHHHHHLLLFFFLAFQCEQVHQGAKPAGPRPERRSWGFENPLRCI